MEISEFIEYVRRYRHEFVGIAHHYFHDEHEVEDAVQDALIRLWMARERIEPPERFRQYGATATRNICLDKIKQKHGLHFVEVDWAEGKTSGPTPQSMLEESENERLMQQCMKELPAKYKELIQMRNGEGLSYKDMANLIGSTESSVRGMVAKARAMLITQFNERRKK